MKAGLILAAILCAAGALATIGWWLLDRYARPATGRGAGR